MSLYDLFAGRSPGRKTTPRGRTVPEIARVRRVDPAAPTTKGERTFEPAPGAEARDRCDNSADTVFVPRTGETMAVAAAPIASSQAGHTEPDQPDASTGLSEGAECKAPREAKASNEVLVSPLAESDRCSIHYGERHYCTECGHRLVPHHDGLWECPKALGGCGVVL